MKVETEYSEICCYSTTNSTSSVLRRLAMWTDITANGISKIVHFTGLQSARKNVGQETLLWIHYTKHNEPVSRRATVHIRNMKTESRYLGSVFFSLLCIDLVHTFWIFCLSLYSQNHARSSAPIFMFETRIVVLLLWNIHRNEDMSDWNFPLVWTIYLYDSQDKKEKKT